MLEIFFSDSSLRMREKIFLFQNVFIFIKHFVPIAYAPKFDKIPNMYIQFCVGKFSKQFNGDFR